MKTSIVFRISADKCTGCLECLRVCDDNAIRKISSDLCAKCPRYCGAAIGTEIECGQNKMCIDEKACTGCGKCVEVCPDDAIFEVR